MIKFLYNTGVSIYPICGMYGKHSRQITYQDEDFISYNSKKPYFM